METSEHRDAFSGICIHGVRGARIEKGQLRSRDCFRCDEMTQVEEDVDGFEPDPEYSTGWNS